MNMHTKPREYTQDKGKFVAEQFADGSSLWSLHREYPDYLPRAMYIKQWRDEYPQFDALMVAAEHALADVLVLEGQTMADEIERPAAHAANSIKIRLARAAALDQMVYGNRRILSGDPDNPLTIKAVRDLTHNELMSIAMGGVVSLPAGEDEPENANQKTPVPPLFAESGGLDTGEGDPLTPTTSPPQDSVTIQKSLSEKKSVIVNQNGIVKSGVDVGF